MLWVTFLPLLISRIRSKGSHRAVTIPNLTKLLLQQLLVIQILPVRSKLADQETREFIDILFRIRLPLSRLHHQLLVQVLWRQKRVRIFPHLLGRALDLLELSQVTSLLQLFVVKLLCRRVLLLLLLNVGERRVVVVRSVATYKLKTN